MPTFVSICYLLGHSCSNYSILFHPIPPVSHNRFASPSTHGQSHKRKDAPSVLKKNEKNHKKQRKPAPSVANINKKKRQRKTPPASPSLLNRVWTVAQLETLDR